ncbi:RDD family protein [Chitinophaga sp. GCM10012297]|uniref:RDD family protein n=1 Tax=Chitinophaga chungangae TaxID=2821488 RepID=A0ABS3Y999_9BACT|nr:RDD family protein [Chitinophaga chungangae]MBO9151211.1 RDD family protein [Chitinophaga chungangae]
MKHSSDLEVIEYPLLIKRIQSATADFLVIILLMLVASKLLEALGEDRPDWVNIVLFIAVWGVYEPLCTAFACTAGNLVCGIRVRDVKDPGKRICLGKAYIRYILKAALGWLSFLTIHSNPERRAIHDLGAGSVMIIKRA